MLRESRLLPRVFVPSAVCSLPVSWTVDCYFIQQRVAIQEHEREDGLAVVKVVTVIRATSTCVCGKRAAAGCPSGCSAKCRSVSLGGLFNGDPIPVREMLGRDGLAGWLAVYSLTILAPSRSMTRTVKVPRSTMKRCLSSLTQRLRSSRPSSSVMSGRWYRSSVERAKYAPYP